MGKPEREKVREKILNKLERGYGFLEYNPENVDLFTKMYPTKSRMTRYLEKSFPLYKNNKIDYYPMGRMF